MTATIQRSKSAHSDGVLGLFYPALGLVRYDFDWRRYGHIDGPINNYRDLIHEYGTIHHEIYHYLQTIGTTYCYYLFLLEHCKAQSYGELLTSFHRGSKLCLPYWVYLNLPAVDSSLTRNQKSFRDTRFQHGNSSHIVQVLLHKATRIAHMNADLLNTLLGFVQDAIKTSTAQHGCFTRPTSSKYASLFNYRVRVSGKHVFPIDEVGTRISSELILENAAFVISTYPLWHEDSRNTTAYVLEESQHFGTAFYTRLVELAARTLGIPYAPTFKNTFLAICDLALHIPTQPHDQNYNAIVGWKDFHPGWRFLRMLDVAKGLNPISSYREHYGSFVRAICERLGWQLPSVSITHFQAVRAEAKDDIGSWLDHEMESALEDKVATPWRFFDPGDVVLDPFMGSGTTAVACKELQRRFVGFELSKDYIKMANERMQKVRRAKEAA